MNSTTDIYLESCKTFWATISRVALFLWYFAGGSLFLLLDWFYFSVRTIWLLEIVFLEENFSKSWDQNPIAMSVWKRYHSTVCIASVRYVQVQDCNPYLHESRSTWNLSIIYLSVYGIHHWRIIWSSYRKLTWVGFEPTTSEFCWDALTDWAIRPWVQFTLRANFVQLLQFHRLFSVQFHFGYCLRQSPGLF